MTSAMRSCGGSRLRRGLSTWRLLSYWPGSQARSCVSSRWRSFSGLAQPPRSPSAGAVAAMSASAASAFRSAIGRPPLRAVLESEIHQALEQIPVIEAAGARGFREILGTLEIRVGIGLEHVDLPLRGHPEIHASVAGH